MNENPLAPPTTTVEYIGANTKDQATRVARGQLRTIYSRRCPVDFGPGIARAVRICNVRARIAVLKDRVRDMHQAHLDALETERRGPGYTWRGWWYPRDLVLGIAWAIVVALFGVLVWLLFTTPVLA